MFRNCSTIFASKEETAITCALSRRFLGRASWMSRALSTVPAYPCLWFVMLRGASCKLSFVYTKQTSYTPVCINYFSATATGNVNHTAYPTSDIKQDNIMFDSYGVESPNYLGIDVVLSDYGTGSTSFQNPLGSPDRHACLATPLRGDHRREIQPVALRCPEALLGCEWTAKADIWNLGCIVRTSLMPPSLFHQPSSVTSLLSHSCTTRNCRSSAALHYSALDLKNGPMVQGRLQPSNTTFAFISSHVCTDDENNGRLMKFFHLDGDRFDHFYSLDRKSHDALRIRVALKLIRKFCTYSSQNQISYEHPRNAGGCLAFL